MAAPITIEVKNGQVIAGLRKLSAAIANPAPAMKLLATTAHREVVRQYRSQKDPQNRPWTPLAASTIKRRRNMRKSAVRILIDTGRLVNSITHEASAREARVGTNTRYAPFHNFGTRRMPQREFMGLTPEAMERTVDRLNEYVARALRESGLR